MSRYQNAVRLESMCLTSSVSDNSAISISSACQDKRRPVPIRGPQAGMLRDGCRRTEGTIAPFRVRNPPDWSSAGRSATYLTATHGTSKDSKSQQTGEGCDWRQTLNRLRMNKEQWNPLHTRLAKIER